MTRDLLKIFVGYDRREDSAWQVCRATLERHSTGIEVHPLKMPTLRELGLYRRAADSNASTEFSLTRFLTPFLAAHDGWSLFVDCDFLFTTDVRDVLAHATPGKAVHVVQHAYAPRQDIKMDGCVQTAYPRKNWSSFMLFDGAHPAVKALTPDVVNSATPAYLHRFGWLADDEIGALPLRWNFLVGEYERPDALPAAIHYTNGGPWFEDYRGVDFADLWLETHAQLGGAAMDPAAALDQAA